MSLNLMYITNNPKVAVIAENAGVDRIFVDMEYIGKDLRQNGMDSVKNHHTVEDVKNIKSVLKKAQLLVRVNPIHDATEEYISSEEEITSVIEAGADVVMLPFFKTKEEVKRFISIVGGRSKTILLLETPEAAEIVDEIVKIPGIAGIHIGINDMSIGLGKTFMFELLSDGTIDHLCSVIRRSGIPYGFGGISAIGTGDLPAEYILKEHYRLGSSMVILSRSFCDTKKTTDFEVIKDKFEVGIKCIRELEREMEISHEDYDINRKIIIEKVNKIVKDIQLKKAKS